MHEQGLARDLVTYAETAAGDTTVRSMRLEIGVLSGVAPDHLRAAIESEARSRWGAVPSLEILVAQDPAARGAGGVLLVGVGV